MRRAIVLIVPGFLILIAVTDTAGHADRASTMPEPAAAQVAIEPLPPDAKIDLVVSHANNPVAMTFAPDGRWFFTERTTGLVEMVSGGSVAPIFQVNPFYGAERGLIGIALDPNFTTNGYIYIYFTSNQSQPIDGRLDNRVVRFTFHGGWGNAETLMLRVPLDSDYTEVHNGGNLHFGPDGKLYASIGDYDNPANAQSLAMLPGKIHRLNPTIPVSAPPDNPFYSNPAVTAKSIYAYGFRNPFDFDFDPVSRAIFAEDNGTSCDDEVNRVLPGYNYGWRPNYPPCEDSSPAGPNPVYNPIPPLINWNPSIAPTGVTFYRGDVIPEWKNDLFVCHWKTGELHHFKLNAARTSITAHTIISDMALGTQLCNLDIETGTDGALYFFRNETSDPTKATRDIYRITRDSTVYASTLSPAVPNPAAGAALTYTMRLIHYGRLTTTFAITSSLPPSTTLIDGSPQAGLGAIVGSNAGIAWTGSITPNASLIATYRVTVSDQIAAPTVLANTMYITTSSTGPIERTAMVIVNGQAVYLPLLLRTSAP